MTLFNWGDTPKDPERRNVPLSFWNLFTAPTQTAAGVSVTENNAEAISAVFRCITLISSVSAALSLTVYKTGTKDTAVARILQSPHPDLTPYEFWRLSYVHRAIWGDFFAIKHRDVANRVVWLEPVIPPRVQVKVSPVGVKTFIIDGKGPGMGTDQVFHLMSHSLDGYEGRSVITMARESMGIAAAADTAAARFYGNGNLLSGILTTESDLDPDEAQAAKDRWKSAFSGPHNAYDIAVMNRGLTFQPMNMTSADAQFLETRQFQAEEVCRWFGVPPFLMMLTEKSTSWGTGLEQQALGWVKFDLHPTWLTPTEQRISKELLQANTEARYNVRELLRGDSKARAEFYRTLFGVGSISPDEIRDAEDMSPTGMPQGKDFYLPLNMGGMSEPKPEPESAPVPADSSNDETDPADNNDE